jgi:hypothetical protein
VRGILKEFQDLVQNKNCVSKCERAGYPLIAGNRRQVILVGKS